MIKYFNDESLLQPIDKHFKKNYLRRNKRLKKSIEYYSGYRSQSQNSYHHQSTLRSNKADSDELFNFKLNDLIGENKSLIKNLYAQINSNSNKISLFYIPSVSNNSRISEQLLYNDIYGRLNLVPLTSLADKSSNANAFINNFYLSAINLENNFNRQNFYESVRMPHLLTSEVLLIAFVISLWLISIIICLKRYSLFICFHKRDVPFYNSSLINVSTKITSDKYSSRPHSPSSHLLLNDGNINKEECNLCSKISSNNALMNKSITQSTNFNLEQNRCRNCSRIRPTECFKSLSNGHFNFSSNKSIHKNFSFHSNRTQFLCRCKKLDCYCSNGMMCPIKKNSSTMLNKVVSKKNAKDSLTSRREIIKSKHFNLMSLDENALYKLNRISHLNSTIHESSLDGPEIEPKEIKFEKKLSVLAREPVHANFISLRSGSDSVNSWIKPGRSYENSDFNDIDSVSSSQFLKLPSQVVLPTSQKPINPLSSLRRHMFANSKRCAQTTFGMDSVANECSVDFGKSMSITSNNQSVIPAIVDEQHSEPNETTVQVVNECNDPNLLNPSWIPLIVRRTLLEMHERAVLSKSDSNIKYKYRSSNHLLHSTSKKLRSNRKKKSLSLQNSQDKSTFYSTSPSNNRCTGSSYLNTFYEELRQRFFQPSEIKPATNEKRVQNFLNEEIKDKMKKSGSNSNTMSTDVSTNMFKFDSKLNSLDTQHSVIHNDKCSDHKLDDQNLTINAEKIDNL